MNKLIAMIMGQNCQKFISMCLDSVKDADEIVYCDGGSTDSTIEIVKLDHWKEPSRKDIKIIENEWDPKDKQMNGKQ